MPQKTTGRGGTFCGAMPRRTRQISFPVDGERFSGSAAGEHHSVGAAQRTQRLPQASRRQQPVGSVLGSYQHDIEVPGEGPVLKTVVEHVKLWAES